MAVLRGESRIADAGECTVGMADTAPVSSTDVGGHKQHRPAVLGRWHRAAVHNLARWLYASGSWLRAVLASPSLRTMAVIVGLGIDARCPVVTRVGVTKVYVNLTLVTRVSNRTNTPVICYKVDAFASIMTWVAGTIVHVGLTV